MIGHLVNRFTFTVNMLLIALCNILDDAIAQIIKNTFFVNFGVLISMNPACTAFMKLRWLLNVTRPEPGVEKMKNASSLMVFQNGRMVVMDDCKISRPFLIYMLITHKLNFTLL